MSKSYMVTEKINWSSFEFIYPKKSTALRHLKDWTRNMDQSGVDWDCDPIDTRCGDKHRRYVAPNGDYIEYKEIVDVSN